MTAAELRALGFGGEDVEFGGLLALPLPFLGCVIHALLTASGRMIDIGELLGNEIEQPGLG